ncbi:MAG TPA: fibronectin type III-like domain-contianing protein, partial [Pyrinomonadaceae bacterium]|nr:fibronectin type III-like domain-contianing protein [Pyrinomonadaceae bacterium]
WEGEKTRVNGALYYFGHGLSYTKFLYSDLQINPATQNTGGNVTVSFSVKNAGAREGDEIAQLYTRDLVSSVTTYEKNLRGFERIHLRPDETKTVSFTLKPDDLSLWDRNMRFVVEPGKFRVMIGSSSEDIRLTGEFSIVAEEGQRR